jgi:uncharacterized protein (DUF486 family)
MTFAWYGHLKFRETPLWIAIVVSWMIAFAEYCFQVPANRIGSYQFSTAQLKTIQEVYTGSILNIFSYLPERSIQMELPGCVWLHCGRGVLHVL